MFTTGFSIRHVIYAFEESFRCSLDLIVALPALVCHFEVSKKETKGKLNYQRNTSLISIEDLGSKP